MSKAVNIARNTFREAIRDRILYNLLVFAVLLIGVSIALGELSIGEQERITIDIGLTSISVFGVLMSIFLGIGLISREIERKTVYTLIAKPVERYTFVLGRWLGLMITIGLNMLIMTAAFASVLWYIRGGGGWPLSWPIIQAIVMMYCELGIITAVAILFSTFSTPTLSAIFTLCFFVIGRLTAGIRVFGEKTDTMFFKYGAEFMYYTVPNLTNYVRIEEALYGEGLPFSLFVQIIFTGVLTAGFFLSIAMLVFQRRDFV